MTSRILLFLFGVGLGVSALADDVAPPPPDAGASETVELSGRDIYERVLANRHKAYFQKQQLVSLDAGGASYTTEVWTRWKDGRDDDGKLKRGVRSKTLAKYTKPSDVRGVGYLIIQKEGAPDDQFVYFPSARRVRRVNLGEAIMGTDYSIEDIIPRDIDSSEYERVADEVVDGVPCFVVEVHPKPGAGSQYSKIRVYVEQEHYVGIRARYWSFDGVEIKESKTPVAEIEEVDGVWLTRSATMRNLVDDSSTTLTVIEMEPNASIRDSLFTQRYLEQKAR
jgi:hypothetical protein